MVHFILEEATTYILVTKITCESILNRVFEHGHVNQVAEEGYYQEDKHEMEVVAVVLPARVN